MKVTYNQEVEAEDTNTTGAYSYLVATECGGLMEAPEIWYTYYQIIHADSPEEAKKKYDEINDCFYFYGKVICQIK